MQTNETTEHTEGQPMTQTNRFAELQALVAAMGPDFEKFYKDGNKAAGTRVRNAMQELKTFAQMIADRGPDDQERRRQRRRQDRGLRHVATIKCPGCAHDMVQVEVHSIEIYWCPSCGGVVLDKGETELIDSLGLAQVIEGGVAAPAETLRSTPALLPPVQPRDDRADRGRRHRIRLVRAVRTAVLRPRRAIRARCVRRFVAGQR